MVAKTTLYCGGKSYSSIAELAQPFNLHPSSVGRRLRDGWTPEQAVGIQARKRLGHPNRVSFQGVHYRDLVELAKAYGVDPRNLRFRLSANKDVKIIPSFKYFRIMLRQMLRRFLWPSNYFV